jgi:tRNA(Ile)-lysidine synthase
VEHIGRRIPVPGVLSDERGRWKLAARLVPPLGEPEARRIAAGRTVAVLDADRAGSLLCVRFRQRGDRVRPLGMSGHRKLQDVLVDARVPRQARDEVPLVVDGAGRIVWVVGHCMAEGVRVSDRTTAVLLLEFRHLEE